MIAKHTEREHVPFHIFKTKNGAIHLRHSRQENVRAALTLLLGPETEYTLRVRAARRIARQGACVLPLLLTTLSTYPEIPSTTYSRLPPQYEHCSRLLLHLSYKLHVRLDTFLQHASLPQAPGPVLWTSVLEAASLIPQEDYEALLCQGLETSWETTRCVAAMALAARANKVALQPTTLESLRHHQTEQEALSVRLTASYALLNSGESVAIHELIQLITPQVPEEIRKAAAFILATELTVPLSGTQREQLSRGLLLLLHDPNTEIALLAAKALRHVALPFVLSPIRELLKRDDADMQMRAMIALEESVGRASIRRLAQEQGLATAVAPLLRSTVPDVRRQASYTLAALGGEYALAVMGAIVLDEDHVGHIEALEGLRLFHNALRNPTRATITRWLLNSAKSEQEAIQVVALDSLAYLLWQTRTNKQALRALSHEIVASNLLGSLLENESAWVRQRTAELLSMIDEQAIETTLHYHLLSLLRTDKDAMVRACVATLCGQMEARWAIPALIMALLDSYEQVALSALNALAQIAMGEDALIHYVIQEVTYSAHPDHRHRLAQSAVALLKKWRK